MEDSKNWYLSKTIMAGLIVGVCGILTLFGVGEAAVAGEESSPIADNVIGLVTAILGLIAVWGRITADKKITK